MPHNPNKDKGLWQCGHPRTLENSVGNRFRYGCRTCAQRSKRAYYYRSIGIETEPLPVAYRNALRGSIRRWTNVGGTYMRERIRETLDAAEPLTRACYLLLVFHSKPVDEICKWLGVDQDDAFRRRDEIAQKLSLTALHDRQFKDWPLVQEMLDAGVSEPEMKQMLGISQPGWDRAKRLGRIRVR